MPFWRLLHTVGGQNQMMILKRVVIQFDCREIQLTVCDNAIEFWLSLDKSVILFGWSRFEHQSTHSGHWYSGNMFVSIAGAEMRPSVCSNSGVTAVAAVQRGDDIAIICRLQSV